MLWASVLLTAGSLVLLASSLFLLIFLSVGLLSLLRFPAIALHFLGWLALALPVGGWYHESYASRAHLRGMIATLPASLLGMGAGISLLPLLHPIDWPHLISWVLFPYLPVVYGPVVLVHVVFMSWSSMALEEHWPRRLVSYGVVVLGIIAVVGVAFQLFGYVSIWVLAPLSGFTAVGYLLTALGWHAGLTSPNVGSPTVSAEAKP